MAGRCNFGDVTVSDLEVRKQLTMPSLDCLVARARLRYLGRIIRSRPASLLAILGSKPAGKSLPWTSLVAQDLRIVWRQVALCGKLPDPIKDAAIWVAFIASDAVRWKSAANTIFFYESTCDRLVAAATPAHPEAQVHACDACKLGFATEKGLKAHMRRKHDVRCALRLFIESAGICQSCLTMHAPVHGSAKVQARAWNMHTHREHTCN